MDIESGLAGSRVGIPWRIRRVASAPRGERESALGNAVELAFLVRTLQELLDACQAAVFITDLSGRIVFVNAAAAALAGGTSANFCLGRHIADILYTPLSTDLRRHRDLLQRAAVAGRVAVHSAVPAAIRSGTLELIDYQVMPVLDEIHELVGGVVFVSEFSGADAWTD